MSKREIVLSSLLFPLTVVLIANMWLNIRWIDTFLQPLGSLLVLALVVPAFSPRRLSSNSSERLKTEKSESDGNLPEK